MDHLQSLFFKNPRITGLILVIAGIGMSIRLWYVFHDGSSLFSRDISYPPGMLVCGLAVLVEPRLLTVWQPDSEDATGKLKAISIAVAVVGAAIGLYLSLVVFKDWKSSWVTRG